MKCRAFFASLIRDKVRQALKNVAECIESGDDINSLNIIIARLKNIKTRGYYDNSILAFDDFSNGWLIESEFRIALQSILPPSPQYWFDRGCPSAFHDEAMSEMRSDYLANKEDYNAMLSDIFSEMTSGIIDVASFQRLIDSYIKEDNLLDWEDAVWLEEMEASLRPVGKKEASNALKNGINDNGAHLLSYSLATFGLGKDHKDTNSSRYMNDDKATQYKMIFRFNENIKKLIERNIVPLTHCLLVGATPWARNPPEDLRINIDTSFSAGDVLGVVRFDDTSDAKQIFNNIVDMIKVARKHHLKEAENLGDIKKYYEHENRSYHVREVSTDINVYKGYKGDNLKRRILAHLKTQLDQCDQSNLESVIIHLQASDKYAILKKAQGYFTHFFGCKTDSVKAFEQMCTEARENLGVPLPKTPGCFF